MSTDIGAKIELDGEAAYREALRGINNELKVNYSEMALAAAQYDETGKSQETLAAKSEALSAAIDTQRSKVDLLATRNENLQKYSEELAAAQEKERARLEALQAAYEAETLKSGKSSAASKELAAQIAEEEKNLRKLENQQKNNETATTNNTVAMNSARTQLVQMQGQQEELKRSMEEEEEGTISVTDVVLGMADAFGIQLPPALESAINKLDGVSAAGVAAAGAVVGITTKLASLTMETSRTADDLLTLSSQTGLSTDQLQEFSYASELVDVSTDNLQGSLVKLTNNMQTAQGGIGDAAEAFKTLGVSVEDQNGHLRDNYNVFLEVIDALGNVENGTERDALAMDIFGKSATQLNPLIDAGSETLKRLGEEAHEVGYVMDEETVGSFGALDDATQRLNKKFDAVGQCLAQILLPVLTTLAELVDAIPTPVLEGIAVAGGVVVVVVAITQAMKAATTAAGLLAAANAALGTSAAAAGVAMSSMMPALLIVAAIAGISVAGYTYMTSKAQENTAAVAASAGMAQNAKGTEYWTGGRTIVGEEGPEVVDLPRGSRIYPNGQGPAGGQSVNNYYVTMQVDLDRVRSVGAVVDVIEGWDVSERKGVR